nr:MAG TPA: hypothetical protein [Caudoviricetes sp.]
MNFESFATPAGGENGIRADSCPPSEQGPFSPPHFYNVESAALKAQASCFEP